MANDADTYLVDTSAGEVNVHYGWESWVVVHRKGSSAQRAVMRNRRGLERLLVDVGVPGIEARALAPGLWKGRPKEPVAPRSTTRGRTRGNDTGT